MQEVLPTPAKSHYICQCTRESLPKVEDLCKVWAHECERVFKDRLTMKQDHQWIFNQCKRQMEKHFKRPYDQVVKLEPLIFADFVDAKSTSYMEILADGMT